MKKFLVLLVAFLIIIGCAAKKPIDATPVSTVDNTKEEVVVEVAQDQKEQQVEVVSVTPVEEQEQLAEAEVVQAPEPVQSEGVYRINSGECLYDLCFKKYDVYVWQLAEMNGIENPNIVPAGMELKIPASKVKPVSSGNFYKVDLGDNLSTIAKETAKTQESLVELNNIGDKNFIKAGSLLRLQ